MSPTRRRTISLTLFATLIAAWFIPTAHALDVTIKPNGFVAVALPATPGATQLWIDVESPGLTHTQAVVRLDGAGVEMRTGPFGITGIVVHDRGPSTLEVALRAPARATVSVMFADVSDRILHSDAATLNFRGMDDPSTPPPATPTAPTTPTDPGHTYVRTAPYTLPGLRKGLNGRDWSTSCQPYSQTERCRTEIWATVVLLEDGRFVRKEGWAFNNLTYLPYMTEASWHGNPLAMHNMAGFTSGGRQWRTECHTPQTGNGACRSYIMTTVYAATAKPAGGYTFSQSNKWVFNHIVMFGAPSWRG
ncbi:hypothetical protein [Tessaracoccus massiliensis]|uniref:hypothetical protein n=1 Tax=Tessaracoccus massiliensis TaxID=1522311 RepID=UPI00058B6ABB|nr:hypothetical protein [Tessaracoccus massiliensis]